MASVMDRWLAALELVRAQDQAREAAQCGRNRQTDADRLQAANARWDIVR